jgi:hypothetical protein
MLGGGKLVVNAVKTLLDAILTFNRHSPVDRCAFVIAQGGENSRIGKVEGQLADSFTQNVKIVVACLIPDVVRRQIARPNDEIDILNF